MAAQNVEKLKYSEGQKIILNDKLSVPVPDGYHYRLNGTGSNENWFYIVPENYSLDNNHADAMPYGFGIANIPLDMRREVSVSEISETKTFFTLFGSFDENKVIDEIIFSKNSFAVFQNWYSSADYMWNLTKGFIVVGSAAYQFQIYMNHSSAIAQEEETISAFLDECTKWLKGICVVNGSTGIKTDANRLTNVTPDKNLYPHYNNLKSVSRKFGGINVVVNSGGTEYSFISFNNALDNMIDDEDDEDIVALYKRIIERDTQSYTLHHKAKEMQKLFHVNESVFNFRHDRECEIEQGLMHRAYMMSALRSFAWTVAEYCDENSVEVSDIAYDTLNELVDYIADRDWLNYSGDSHCQGLCGCSDLHVFYIPDGVTESDKNKLRPSEEDYETFRQMKERFPSYNEILSDVHSLDMLRKDLEFILPAVEVLYENLKARRNFYEELDGNEADIVYAWCALASAAKEPFFSEDGPSSCFFTQIENSRENNSFSDPVVNRAKEYSYPVADSIEEYDDCCVNLDDFSEEYWEEKGFEFIFDTELSEYNGENEDVIIPNGVTCVRYEAFGYKDIESVVIPRSVTKIDSSAFESCNNLREIIIPDSVTEIGGSAFKNCSSLEKAKISENLTKISYSVFEDCSSLDSITLPYGVTEIESSAFQNCSSLENITIPESVTEIGEWAFEGCTNLKNIIIPGSVRAIGDYAFSGCSSLESVIILDGVTEIKEKVFYRCTNLKSVIVPGSINTIGNNAFNGCSSLENVTLSDGIVRIGESVFRSCSSLKKIRIPDSVIEIGRFVFERETFILTTKGSYMDKYGKENWCNVIYNENFLDENFEIDGTVLKKYKGSDSVVEIPGGITEIAYCAFEGCDTITKIIIPDSVTDIDFSAFEGCSNLENISIPDSITEIKHSTFSDCINLKRISLPCSLETIQSLAFNNCINLDSVQIPDSVKTIEDTAFRNCNSLTAVTIPDSVEEFGAEVFQGCIGLETVKLPEGLTEIPAATFYNCENLVSVVIPESVTKIDESAFENCISLENIKLPERITKIKKDAFNGCTKLKNLPEITDEPDADITKDEIFDDRFEIDGTVLKKNKGDDTIVIIPKSITDIGYNAFENCNRITTIIIPDSITKIQSFAFNNCSNLESISLPDGIVEIGYGAFNECSSLESITIPDSVEEIGARAFYGCTELTHVELSLLLKKIGDYAFAYCSSLETIVIHSGVTQIGDFAFADCSSLRSVELFYPLTRIGSFAFSYCSALKTIIIPESVTEMGDCVYPSDIIISVKRGGFTEEYARKNNLTFMGIY